MVFDSGNGFSSGGDGIRLWGPNAQDAGDVVDSVDFGDAVRGSTFVYDPVTGEFGVISTNGVGGALKAAASDDVGSPGQTTGPTPLFFTQQPADVIVNPGDTAMFTIAAQGRPRGSVQWYYKDAAIPGATQATLKLPDAQSSTAGSYYAMISNGVTSVRSDNAQLVLATEATPPAFTKPRPISPLMSARASPFKLPQPGCRNPGFAGKGTAAI